MTPRWATVALALGCGHSSPDTTGSNRDSAAVVDDSDTSDGDDSTLIIDEDEDGSSPPGDCDDHDASVHPGADERCVNGVDDDCDGVVDRCVLPIEATDRLSIEIGLDYSPYGGGLDFEGSPGADVLWICNGGEPSKDRWGAVTALDGSTWPARSILGSDDAIIEAVDASGDADGDGLSDLFIAGGDETRGDAAAWIWSNPVVGDGLEVVDADARVDGAGLGYFAKSRSVGDVDADGYDDWFLIWGGSWLVAGPLTGVIEVPDGDRVWPGVPNTFEALGADLDADGLNDLVAGGVLTDGSGDGVVNVFLGPFAGAPLTEVADHSFEGRNLGYAIAAGDLDGDGANELVVGGGAAGNSRLFVVDQPLAEGPSVAEASVAQIEGRDDDDAIAWALAVGDVDGDGAADIVESTATDFDTPTHDGELSIVRGPVSGTVGIDDVASLIVEGDEDDQVPGHGMAMGDLDEDGVLDIAVESAVWNAAHTTVLGSEVHIITPGSLIQP